MMHAKQPLADLLEGDMIPRDSLDTRRSSSSSLSSAPSLPYPSFAADTMARLEREKRHIAHKHKKMKAAVEKKEKGMGHTNAVLASRDRVIRDEMAGLKQRATVTSSTTEVQGLRQSVLKTAQSIPYEIFVAICIAMDLTLLIVQTDLRQAFESQEHAWLQHSQRLVLVFFILDMVALAWAQGLAFWKHTGQLVDAATVFFGLYVELASAIPQVLPSFKFLKTMRFLRVARVLRSVTQLHDLYLLMMGIAQSIKTLLFASLLIFVVLTMFSVLAVELIHDLNVELFHEGVYGSCSDCDQAFESVMKANLTFLKTLIAGDGWGALAWPLILRSPAAGFILIASLMVVHVGLLNTVAAVLVDRQQQAREKDQAYMDLVMAEDLLSSYIDLQRLFEDMDSDQSGCTNVSALFDYYDNVPQFRSILNRMDIHRSDLCIVFDIIDTDSDGNLQFGEFVSGLHALKSENAHTLLIFIKYYTSKLFKSINISSEIWASTQHMQRQLEEQTRTLALLPGTAARQQLRPPRWSSKLHRLKEEEASSVVPSSFEVCAAEEKSAAPRCSLNSNHHRRPPAENYTAGALAFDTCMSNKASAMWSEAHWLDLASDMDTRLLAESKVGPETIQRVKTGTASAGRPLPSALPFPGGAIS
eukprot:TRINITY_DN58424_c0_g1_i1.p1 TRINITY_DN58424_c0_g1~~TRINITY_DN58424_c0_g1_i1.p1  ORF type:complete len:644 (-),score=104.64 TRINITY_DN58424_c0_g1_i1:475-2406(-)